VPAGAKDLGEICVQDAECATGICTGGACSTCHTGSAGGSDCATGETCGPDWMTGFDLFTPYVCNPNGMARASGQPCASDDDCMSGTCSGEPYSECSDGRPCTNASECPLDSSLENGDCNLIGVTGGVCR
jgi:hypothetical protein